jgi:hypothetical protein
MPFKPGSTYQTRSICDHETVIGITVVSRTAKTLTTSKGKMLRIGNHGDGEFVKPWGSYSMCPIITATDEVTA